MRLVVHNHLPRRRARDNSTEQVNKFGSLDATSFMVVVRNDGVRIPRLEKSFPTKESAEKHKREFDARNPSSQGWRTEILPMSVPSRDYQANMHHFGAVAEWPDGKKSNIYLMAKTLEDAKRQFKSQVNVGGWPKLTNIRLIHAQPEPR
jgi:hypothetical protein